MRTATAAARALRRTPKASPSARFSTFRPSQNASNPIPNIPNNPAEAQKKAQETLNAAVSSAKSGFEKAQNSQAWKSAKDGLVKAKDSKVWEKAQSALGPVGQKAGQALGRYREPFLYNLTVARELFKQVYVAELKPPTSVAQVKSVYQDAWKQAGSRAFWRDTFSKGDLSRLGIYGLQAYGLFKIGEMVGRLHLVGYNLH
ncbi:mitochondrial ATP synthase g subunit-domain-containing protein [Pterulicium gracile]|uniref:Mitochondrial ATP synthase g subunit-domain-containing protein n=1 Tax=Pterulicium gracile TaxID=1884261 RepID=A0A5C3QSH5_9AGAR|nr:mitochondrial ATP synthase g subunit-domain-containing protein [Pterula gracilis]